MFRRSAQTAVNKPEHHEKPSRKTNRRPRFEALETRVMLSADPLTMSALPTRGFSPAVEIGGLTPQAADAAISAPTSRAASSAAGSKTWTVMVYMDGDNNLESAAITDFLEMSKVNNPDVNIIVQMDRYSGKSDTDSSYGNWSGTKRFCVTAGTTPTARNSVMDVGEANMGDPSTLVNFTNWAMTNYRADRYGLILWDHGGGWQSGVCFDDTNKGDSLSMVDLHSAMKSITGDGARPLNLLGMDACLMGGLEVASEVQNYCKQFVASADVKPGDGWEYQNILAPAHLSKTNPNAEVWAEYIVTSYKNRYDADNSTTTMMAADAKQIANVASQGNRSHLGEQ
jgi:clostripain